METMVLKEKNPFLKIIRQNAFDAFEKLDTSILPENITMPEKLCALNAEKKTIPDDNPPLPCNMEKEDVLTCFLIDGNTLLNVDGILTESDICLCNITDLPRHLERYFGNIAEINDNAHVALNTAAFTGGFCLEVPDNTECEIPVQLVSVNNTPFMNVRNLIVVGENSSVKLINCDDSSFNSDFFTNTVTEIFVKDNAKLDISKMYNLSNKANVNNAVFIQQARNSTVKSFNFEFNSGVLRSDIKVRLIGEGAESYIYGIYLADKHQQMFNNVLVDHLVPHCTSEQIFKGIIDEYAQSVFEGRVIVERDAQHTIASQVNKNLLLTDTAKASAKPFLEIYADDVKCSHGATVGQLDEEAMFYMQTRGISFDHARMLLMHAFIGEVVSKIEIDKIKLRVNDLVKKRLNGELSACDNCIIRCSDSKINDPLAKCN